jgi:hypothetical protein
MDPVDLRHKIGDVLLHQKFGVFTSITPSDSPHPSLVAFIASADLSWIVFATPLKSRKIQFLDRHPSVSFFWDSRHNVAEDVQTAVTITAFGRAEIPKLDTIPELKRQYLARHPYMEDFVESPSTTLVIVHVNQFEVVSQFQTVEFLVL